MLKKFIFCFFLLLSVFFAKKCLQLEKMLASLPKVI